MKLFVSRVDFLWAVQRLRFSHAYRTTFMQSSPRDDENRTKIDREACTPMIGSLTSPACISHCLGIGSPK